MAAARLKAGFELKGFAHYVHAHHGRIGTEQLTVIVVLALVALFIGLRLYSVLGERTGHEQQQPILKPADPEAIVEPRVTRPVAAQPTISDGSDLAYLPTAGPGVRALLAADPSFDVARFLEGAKSAYQMVLEAYWKGDSAALRPFVDDHVYETFTGAIQQREKDGLVLDNRLVNVEQALITAASAEHDIAVALRSDRRQILVDIDAHEGEVEIRSIEDHLAFHLGSVMKTDGHLA